MYYIYNPSANEEAKLQFEGILLLFINPLHFTYLFLLRLIHSLFGISLRPIILRSKYFYRELNQPNDIRVAPYYYSKQIFLKGKEKALPGPKFLSSHRPESHVVASFRFPDPSIIQRQY